MVGQIYAAVRNAGGDLSHKAIREAATVMHERRGKYIQTLKAILAGVKPQKAMSDEDAAKTLAQLIADGHLVLIMNTVGAEIAHLPTKETVKPVFLAMNLAMEMFNTNKAVTEQDFQDWMDEHNAAKAPVEAPAPETAPVKRAA